MMVVSDFQEFPQTGVFRCDSLAVSQTNGGPIVWFTSCPLPSDASLYTLLYACNRGPPSVPLLFYFLTTAPIGFVHVFQLWIFPEPWTL